MEKEIVIIRETRVCGELESRLVVAVRYTVNSQMNLDAARGALWGLPQRALLPPERGGDREFWPF
jgi:hypothetical protein